MRSRKFVLRFEEGEEKEGGMLTLEGERQRQSKSQEGPGVC